MDCGFTKNKATNRVKVEMQKSLSQPRQMEYEFNKDNDDDNDVCQKPYGDLKKYDRFSLYLPLAYMASLILLDQIIHQIFWQQRVLIQMLHLGTFPLQINDSIFSLPYLSLCSCTTTMPSLFNKVPSLTFFFFFFLSEGLEVMVITDLTWEHAIKSVTRKKITIMLGIILRYNMTWYCHHLCPRTASFISKYTYIMALLHEKERHQKLQSASLKLMATILTSSAKMLKGIYRKGDS